MDSAASLQQRRHTTGIYETTRRDISRQQQRDLGILTGYSETNDKPVEVRETVAGAGAAAATVAVAAATAATAARANTAKVWTQWGRTACMSFVYDEDILLSRTTSTAVCVERTTAAAVWRGLRIKRCSLADARLHVLSETFIT